MKSHKNYGLGGAFFLLLPLLALLRSVDAFSQRTKVQQQVARPPLRHRISPTHNGISTTLWARPTIVLEKEQDVATIQILMSDTGGGHRASANALRDAFDVLHPGQIQCDIVDIYTEYGPFWPFNDYVEGYKIMAKYPILWDIFYHVGCTPFGLWLNEFLLETFCFEPFKGCLGRPSGDTGRRADMVISVHPLCQDIPLRILAELDSNGKTRDPEGRVTPFCTVVTDLGSAHPTWFNSRYVNNEVHWEHAFFDLKFQAISYVSCETHRSRLCVSVCLFISPCCVVDLRVDKCFVPSDALDEAARKRNLQPSQIVQYGLPIRKGFWDSTGDSSPKTSFLSKFGGRKTEEKNEGLSALRVKLELDAVLPTVLVVGGGDGMGGIIDISDELGEELGKAGDGEAAYQLVVVCGNNNAARETLQARSWGSGVIVDVQGFVNNMDEFMRASDVLVTKAGPGTIAEASICGLPCMLSSYL
jgi:1,2-diacylglycerol 3-beta-galactosyltransferase